MMTVDEVFGLPERGPLLLPGVALDYFFGDSVGMPLKLVSPEGAVTETVLHGIEWPDPRTKLCAILIGQDVSVDGVPAGTQVWGAPPEAN